MEMDIDPPRRIGSWPVEAECRVRRSGRSWLLAGGLALWLSLVASGSPGEAVVSPPEPLLLEFGTATPVSVSGPAHPPVEKPAAALATPSPPGAAASQTNPGQITPPVNPALLADAAGIATTNLALDSSGTAAGEKKRKFEVQLEMARRLRLERDPAAARTLVALLESNAPAEYKRTALLELAVTALQESDEVKAQQIYAQFLNRYPDDSSVPEVLLRQGMLYRKMGSYTLALSKFYAVMTAALNLKLDQLEHYQRLVCQAKVEIGDTYYMQAKYEEAAECYQRMVKDEFPGLNKGAIYYKWIRCLAYGNRHAEVATQARVFLDRFPETPEQPEVRFLLASAHKQLGHIQEALQQVLLLLQSQTRLAAQNPENWIYWQQRAGNEIANQLYKEGDYLNALNIYLNLGSLDASPAWQLPVGYQIGMVYEHLNQPQKAIQAYRQLLGHEKELGTNASPGLRAVLDMAKWRQEFLSWQIQAEQSNHDYRLAAPSVPGVPPAK